MSRTTLYTNDSSTATGIREASFDEIVTAAREQMSFRVRRGTSLSSPRATRDYLALKLGTLEREVFAVIFLDKRHRLISYQEMFQGTIDGAMASNSAFLLARHRDGQQLKSARSGPTRVSAIRHSIRARSIRRSIK